MQTILIHDVTVYLLPIHDGKTDKRRQRERETVRDIIRRVLGNEAELHHAPSGAPSVTGPGIPEDLNISISHSATTAAVALRKGANAGVDIEEWRTQLRKVAPRFLSPEERENFASPEQLLKAWTSKEAVFKAAGVPDLTIADVSLSPDLTIASIPDKISGGSRRFRLFHTLLPDNACLTIALPDE